MDIKKQNLWLFCLPMVVLWEICERGRLRFLRGRLVQNEGASTQTGERWQLCMFNSTLYIISWKLSYISYQWNLSWIKFSESHLNNNLSITHQINIMNTSGKVTDYFCQDHHIVARFVDVSFPCKLLNWNGFFHWFHYRLIKLEKILTKTTQLLIFLDR